MKMQYIVGLDYRKYRFDDGAEALEFAKTAFLTMERRGDAIITIVEAPEAAPESTDAE